MNVPTTAQIATTFEGIARTVATILVAVYVAGTWTRDTLQGFASWIQRLTAAPLQTLIDLVPTVDPEPSRALLDALGAEILEPEALELEIQAYEETKPVSRRKPAKARKAAVAA